MTWSQLDWSALDRLRTGFLSGSAAAGPYWQSLSDLANYDFTYGARIGWKWDAVLAELSLRNWRPSARTVLDWGCGSGVAARRVLAAFGGSDYFTQLHVWDHSPLAVDFSAAAAKAEFPLLNVTAAPPEVLIGQAPIGLLVISHVLNELDPTARAQLDALIARATAILWVEPGTHEVSRQLGSIRETLRMSFSVIAPCTHAGACGMFLAEHSRDWCHFFARPPTEIFATPDWVKFGQRAGIDLRSLPYAFFVLDRAPTPSAPMDLARIIGRPEHFKPYARFLNCDANGLNELELLKRSDPALYKQLDRARGPLIYRWRREANKVQGGEPLI
ncbi:MAG: small ribosomal subunit Rsm22 family protein [Opitutaceae bacterium]